MPGLLSVAEDEIKICPLRPERAHSKHGTYAVWLLRETAQFRKPKIVGKDVETGRASKYTEYMMGLEGARCDKDI